MAFTAEPYDESASLNLLVCNACGTQHPTTDRLSLPTCFICDDPRQYVPPAGQSFSTLLEIRKAHRNVFTPYAADKRLTFIQSEPKVGIGQRAILIRTAEGNVLWDCVTLLDDETIARIQNLGGLKAIVISHPHFYSTHVEWGRAFGCPVYLSGKDRMWLARKSSHQVFMDEVENAIAINGKPSQMKAIVLGGHFPGSLVLLWDGRLMIADTLLTGWCNLFAMILLIHIADALQYPAEPQTGPWTPSEISASGRRTSTATPSSGVSQMRCRCQQRRSSACGASSSTTTSQVHTDTFRRSILRLPT
jgi:hypothetical protein